MFDRIDLSERPPHANFVICHCNTKSDQEIELVCTIVGRVELVGNDMQLVIDREQSHYPLASAATRIKTPWPKDIYSNQQWSVIPKMIAKDRSSVSRVGITKQLIQRNLQSNGNSPDGYSKSASAISWCF